MSAHHEKEVAEEGEAAAAQDTAVILGREQGRLAEEADAAAAAATRAAAVLQVEPNRRCSLIAWGKPSQKVTLFCPASASMMERTCIHVHCAIKGLLFAVGATPPAQAAIFAV